MFPFEPLWAYVGVPAVLVSILVLIKLRQVKMDQRVESALAGEEGQGVRPSEEAAGEGLVGVKETKAEPRIFWGKGVTRLSPLLGVFVYEEGS